MKRDIDITGNVDDIWVSAEDIRQYAYCPRKIYYRYVLRHKIQTTPKIDRGKEIHRATCRNKKPERIGTIERYYNVYLKDDTLKISGYADVIEWDGTYGSVIDLKTGRLKENKIWYPDRMQLIALAILAEDSFQIVINKIGIWNFKKNEIIWDTFKDKDRLLVIGISRKIREIIASEVFPKAKKSKKCISCECRKYCFGIF